MHVDFSANVPLDCSTSATTLRQNAGMRALLAITSIFLVCGFSLTCAAQGDLEVDAELVIAVDVSRSMTARELEIQRQGYAAALVSDEVLEAISHGFLGQIAITCMEWAGSQSQRVVIDWMLIRGQADAEVFAAKLTARAFCAKRDSLGFPRHLICGSPVLEVDHGQSRFCQTNANQSLQG
jgi:hypothetical protein